MQTTTGRYACAYEAGEQVGERATEKEPHPRESAHLSPAERGPRERASGRADKCARTCGVCVRCSPSSQRRRRSRAQTSRRRPSIAPLWPHARERPSQLSVAPSARPGPSPSRAASRARPSPTVLRPIAPAVGRASPLRAPPPAAPLTDRRPAGQRAREVRAGGKRACCWLPPRRPGARASRASCADWPHPCTGAGQRRSAPLALPRREF